MFRGEKAKVSREVFFFQKREREFDAHSSLPEADQRRSPIVLKNADKARLLTPVIAYPALLTPTP